MKTFSRKSGALMNTMEEMDRLLESLAKIALEAGRTILEIYEVGPKVQLKADRSPVCDADEAAEAIILSALEKLCPNLPVIAEEALARGRNPEIGQDFILVDPLDGTREFLSRNGEFTVNIGLVHEGTPCCGVVYAPALGRLWVGGTISRAVEAKPGAVLPPIDSWRPIKARAAPQDGLTALVSRSHSDPTTEMWLAKRSVKDRREVGSALKFCLLAEGDADVYPRFGPTMEWDTAAGHAVLQSAGGAVVTSEGLPLRYGKAEAGFKNPSFVAWGDRQAQGLKLVST